ncbi:MAG: hypothetical protein IH609_06325 [Dehalococcoidia bacterium]|nr:hypothetical protein [Dehalococcoidia bacterium]
MDDPTPESTTAREPTHQRRRLRMAAIERARELVRRYVEGTPSMADELLAERAEAEK